MYDILLFDLDGTLTDSKLGITKSVAYALEKFHIPVDDLDELTPFVGPPLVESFQKYYGFSLADAKQGVAYYREYFADRGIYENAVYPGITELLTELRKTSKTLMVATAKPTFFAAQVLDYFRLTPYFDKVMGSNLDGTLGKKAEVIQAIIDEWTPDKKRQTVMIGDRQDDVLGARAAGLDSIGALYGFGGEAELTTAGATYLVHSVHELQNFLLAH